MPMSPSTSAWRARVGVLAAVAVLAFASIGSACAGSHKSSGTSVANLTQPSPTVTSAPVTAAAATPTPAPDESPVAQFSLPKYNVSGKIVVMGIDPATNVMQSPSNKDDVAYYDFSGKPGFGCPSQGKCANAVLSGHVDWYTGQVGVFWHLKDLGEGDEIDLKLEDGTLYKYKVVANTIYKSDDAPVQEIVGDTPQESVTLITCDGVFNKQLQEYNSRRIVRAVREA